MSNFFTKDGLRLSRKKGLAFKILGNRCVRCGVSDTRVLQIDHIKGNGSDERRLFGSNYHFVIYAKIIQGSTDYQLLCANCNWIKRHDNKEHKSHGQIEKARQMRRDGRPAKDIIGFDANGYPYFKI